MRTESWLRLMSGLVLVGVFAAGALFGAGLLRFAGPPGPPPPPGPIEAMTHELALDADQVAALHHIADAHRGDLEAVMREVQPRLRTVLYAIEDEMKPHLRADQIERLAQWRAHRGPPPMPGMPH
jgi:Heavy-metal resistance